MIENWNLKSLVQSLLVALALIALGVIALTLVGCGDNYSAPEEPDALEPDAALVVVTWDDAEAGWADAWCTYEARCYPAQLEMYFGDLKMCREKVRAQNCALRVAYGFPSCAEPFPESGREYLTACFEDMADIACEATEAPDSCYAAWGSS